MVVLGWFVLMIAIAALMGGMIGSYESKQSLLRVSIFLAVCACIIFVLSFFVGNNSRSNCQHEHSHYHHCHRSF